jgi:hypothetical protein
MFDHPAAGHFSIGIVGTTSCTAHCSGLPAPIEKIRFQFGLLFPIRAGKGLPLPASWPTSAVKYPSQHPRVGFAAQPQYDDNQTRYQTKHVSYFMFLLGLFKS